MLLVLCAVRVAAATAGAQEPAGRSKKAQFLVEKASRRSVRAGHPIEREARRLITLRNVWTDEVLPIDPARPPAAAAIDGFLRDHFTNQATAMDPRLASLLLRTANRFKARLVEVVSGYRAPKYQLMLRKKGREVARDSQHPLGHAVDFRLPGQSTRALYKYVRSLRAGGVGLYPDSAFVHADVGRVRFWRGH